MIIDVVCALIRNEQGELFAARRSSVMDMPGRWEFPGGKIEPAEAPEEAIVREIREELDILVIVQYPLQESVYHYEDKSIRLFPFICSVESGNMVLKEHQSCGWFNRDELAQLDWAEADIPVLASYLETIR